MVRAFKRRWPLYFSNVYCGFSLPEGWRDIVWKLCEDLQRNNIQIRVAQVKEKFAGLRFYYDVPEGAPEDTWEKARELVSATEHFSYMVCEDCGTTKSVDVQGSWLTAKCAMCRKQRAKQDKWDRLRWNIRWFFYELPGIKQWRRYRSRKRLEVHKRRLEEMKCASTSA